MFLFFEANLGRNTYMMHYFFSRGMGTYIYIGLKCWFKHPLP